MTSQNASLLRAKEAKNDEFYTLLEDIEEELQHYEKHFEGKTVYCNCDDPEKSNFVVYFMENFNCLGLKRLIATHYVPVTLFDYIDGNVPSTPKMLDYDGNTVIFEHMKSDGDFRSRESVRYLEESDIVVTNPPFTLLRDFVELLVRYDKKYLFIGDMNTVTTSIGFPLIMNNKMWLGNKTSHWFFTRPDGSIKTVGPISWFTNLEYDYTPRELELTQEYCPEKYFEFDNYRVINVDKVSDIPKDYYGVMGVPITYITYYDRSKFRIVGMSETALKGMSFGLRKPNCERDPLVNGQMKYTRLFIKRR